ncbi:thiamine pyrophosphate-binding protein [Aliarcobacter butzleri]|uniref:thiamine pyrophosphate-binding protein n=1 Tax=Aliarcobacter butzleri TaxID=28197 RepID=UPI002B24227F|nr:thiamine pyrophosphate-binding protein [Aliarcobacter butzleri]
MIKVSDFIAKFLAEHKDTGNTVFMVSGGGNMHLIDSLGRNKDLEYVCNHHEQACTFASEGYARVSNKIGLAYVTTGPGGTNAITGVYSAWVDSIPTLTISGQVKFETTIASQPELKLRQLGDQEVNIIDLVKPITKYAVMIIDKNSIKYHLQKAVFEAKNGRPGPVWLDIPLDIQGALVDENDLYDFDIPKIPKYDLKIDEVIEALKSAKRPVIIAGNGVRLSNSINNFINLIGKLNIPTLTSISGIDLIPTEHNLFFGRPGILGERAANFIVQNSDLVLILGTRLNLRHLSFNWEFFARDAKKIMVDIDENELNKKTFVPDLKIKANVKEFIELLIDKKLERLNINNWLDYCYRIKKDYPVINDKQVNRTDYVSSYYFPILLSQKLSKNSVIVTGNGIAYTSTYQTYNVREGDRIFANLGCASMGYDLPASIGACVANNYKDIICLTGDGSIQMNLQELQTIIHYQLPIKIFMYNNNGYLSIRITQTSYFNKNFVGESPISGVTIPDMKKLALAYGFKVYQIRNNKEAEQELEKILNEKEPVFCEVMLDPVEEIGPKVASYKKENGEMVSKPMEDLAPFLERKEFYKNMIIKPIKE